MNREDKLLNTETQLTQMIETVVDKVKPTECNLHSQLIKDFQDDINSLSRELGIIRKCQETKEAREAQCIELLDKINTKLFISNGEICMSENMRNIKGKVDRHIEDHGKIQVSGKLIASIVASILLGLSSLAFNFIKQDDKPKITHEQVKDILIKIMEQSQ